MRVALAAKVLGQRRILVAATAVAALGAAPGVAMAASPGQLDSGFGSGGSVRLAPNMRLFGATAQSNGDLVAVGEAGLGSTVRLVLVRLTPTGALDKSFGSGGYVLGPAVSGAGGSIGRAVAITSSGKIVAVGQASDQSGTAQDGLLVERFNSNGSPDSSFGTGGVVNELATQSGAGYGVAIQPNGDIVAVGQATPSTTPYVAAERLTSSGHLDPSFGSGGIDILNLGPYSMAQSAAVQPNGAIVIVGSQSPNLQAVNAVVARLKPSGGLDPSFAGSGAIAKQYGVSGGAYSSFNAALVQGNGDIDAIGTASGGNSDGYTVVARFKSSGSPDGSFGTGGTAYTTSATHYLGQSSATPPGGSAAVLAPNGDIIVAGQFADSVISYGTLWAFNSSGKLDQSFGSNGVAAFNAGQGTESEWGGLAISPTTGYLDPVGDTFKPGGNGFGGLAASYVGYGKPTSGPGTTPLKLTISHVSVSYKSGYLKFTAACNQACSLATELDAGAGAARALKVGSTVKKCKKSHGKTKCKRVKVYRAVRLASGHAKLGKAGSHTFTLRLSRGARNALHRQRSVTLSYQVTASSSSGATVKFHKTVKFKR